MSSLSVFERFLINFTINCGFCNDEALGLWVCQSYLILLSNSWILAAVQGRICIRKCSKEPVFYIWGNFKITLFFKQQDLPYYQEILLFINHRNVIKIQMKPTSLSSSLFHYHSQRTETLLLRKQKPHAAPVDWNF